MDFKKNKGFFISLITVLLIGIAGISVAANNNGLLIRDKLIESDPKAKEKTISVIKEQKHTKKVIIEPSEEMAEDGGLIYKVKDKENKELGNFNYKPWNSAKDLYFELENGDVILGKEAYYSEGTNTVYPLAEKVGLYYVFDLAVKNNKVAVIGKKENGEVNIVLYANGDYQFIDSFKFPNNYFAEGVRIDWGSNNNIIYDFFVGEKPVIKSFSVNEGSKQILFENCLGPQCSPDGKYIVISKIVGEINDKERELQLINLDSNTQVMKLDGSDKIFWDNNSEFIANWDADEAKILLYDIKSGKKLSKDFKFNGSPKLKIDNGKLIGDQFIFDNGKVEKRFVELIIN